MFDNICSRGAENLRKLKTFKIGGQRKMTKWALRDMIVGATKTNDTQFFCKCYKVAMQSKLFSKQERHNMFVMFMSHYLN